MKKPLLDVVFSSEKRKSVVLLLKDGPQEMDFLLKSLDTTRQALLPQIRILEEQHLVTGSKDVYELTTIGKLMVDEMKPLVATVEIFDADIDYWGTRKLDFLPPDLLKNISRIGKCEIMNPSLHEMYALPQQIYGAFEKFQETVKKLETFTGVSTFFYPNYYEVFSNMVENHVKVNVIITQDMFDKVRNPEHAHIAELLKSEYLNFYVYPGKIDFVSFAYNENHLLLRLLNLSGVYDHKYVLCEKPEAREWGKELFEYYLKDSIPITEEDFEKIPVL